MKTFPALDVPDDPAAVPGFLRELVAQIREAAGRPDTFLELRPLAAEPARLREGMVIEADGSNFDPGSGAGLYVRRSGAWVFIG